MHDDQMYGDARMAKLRELKKLMMELALEDENGEIKAGDLQAALDEAGNAASDVEGEETAEMETQASEMGIPEENEAEEEDPLAVARRKFFKPKRQEETRRPGTAILMAAMEKPKPEMPRKGMGKGKAS